MTWLVLPGVPCCAIEGGLGSGPAVIAMLTACVPALLAIRAALRRGTVVRGRTAALRAASRHGGLLPRLDKAG